MRKRRTVLITNIWLDNFAGSEVVVRDLALGLLRHGHRPIVYSPSLGAIARQIAARGVSVIDDLGQLAESPDIIHGHHAIPCGEALIRFPDVPAIFVCHGFDVWIEAPVHFPQIGAYVAVDEACRDRLVHTQGIDPERVLLFPNAVNLDRIPPRPSPLADRPLRAVAFGKAAWATQLRAACEKLNIAFDAIGAATNQVNPAPERDLVKYDLVFASARCALEALCCGCAVIVCDQRGLGGMVTLDNYSLLRPLNFGLRSLLEPVTVERCVQELNRYNAEDAAKVSTRARADADLNALLDRYEQLYEEVLTGPRRPHITEEGRELAQARFLHEYLPRTPGDGRWPWLAEREKLKSEIETRTHEFGALQSEIGKLKSEIQTQTHELGALQSEIGELTSEIETRTHELGALQSKIGTLTRQLEELQTFLKRSCLLKFGRLLWRLTGRAAPY
jgi:HAMP domain-containing protein